MDWRGLCGAGEDAGAIAGAAEAGGGSAFRVPENFGGYVSVLAFQLIGCSDITEAAMPVRAPHGRGSMAPLRSSPRCSVARLCGARPGKPSLTVCGSMLRWDGGWCRWELPHCF